MNKFYIIISIILISFILVITNINIKPKQAPTSLPVEEEKPLDIHLVKGKVERVVDGDTAIINIDGESFRVRFIGVNTPESTTRIEEYGKEASNFTKKYLTGKEVYLEKDVSETDKYGRLLRYIWLEEPSSLDIEEIENKMFNAILLKEGYAKVATYPPDVKYADTFVQIQRSARENNLGLWGN